MRLLLLCCSLLFSGLASAAGIEFFHGTWEEAMALAEREDKLIFVDAYTTWCGPCKRMSRNVFPKDEVGAVFNPNFINIKLDMENEESLTFRQVHRVSAFPTLFFINHKNEVIKKSVGGKQPQSLIQVATEALSTMDDVEAMAADWEAGNRTAAKAFKYVRALQRREDASYQRVANDYLRQPDGALTDEYNLRLLHLAATESDSRIFDLLTDHRAAAEQLLGADEVASRIESAIQATVDKAIEFRDDKLLAETVKKMSRIDKTKGTQLKYASAYEAALRGGDADAFVKATNRYLKKGTLGEEARLRHVFQSASGSKFAEKDAAIDLVESVGQQLGEVSASGWRDFYNLATFLEKMNRPARALAAARKSLEKLPEGNQNYARAIQGLIERLDATR